MNYTADAGAAGSIIRKIAASDQPLGWRLRQLDLTIETATKERHRLSIQLGVETAKHLFAAGVEPTGETMTPERWEQIA